MAHGLTGRNTLVLCKSVSATTALRPVLDHPIKRSRRQQRPALALVTRLRALGAIRDVLAPPRWSTRTICARWLGAVLRAAGQPALELCDPLILASNVRLKLHDPAIHRQQNLDYSPTPRVIDRLSLGALHKL